MPHICDIKSYISHSRTDFNTVALYVDNNRYNTKQGTSCMYIVTKPNTGYMGLAWLEEAERLVYSQEM